MSAAASSGPAEAGASRDGRDLRWNQHREQRRRHILDAAVEVVEAAPAGSEMTLQDVAEQAGLVRTVVQRHFGGRSGLLRAVQADVLREAFSLISAPIDASVTFRQLISQLVGETVRWVHDHPNLHVLVEREVGDGGASELSKAIDSYADFMTEVEEAFLAPYGVELDERALREVKLLYTGVIGQVRATVSHWAQRQSQVVSADELRDLLADWIEAQIVRHAETRGVAFTPTTTFGGVVGSEGA